MSTLSKRIPEVGLLGTLPEGYVPGDDESPQFEAAVEERCDELLSNPDNWIELLERAALSPTCRDAFAAFMNTPSTTDNKIARHLRWVLVDIATDAARDDLSS